LGLRNRIAAAAIFCAAGRPLLAQGDLFERLNLDKLQLTSLGVSAGKVFPSQVVPTTIYALAADYGEIAPAWHVIFGASYWESQFRGEFVQAFADTVSRSIDSVAARVRPSRILLYDITLSVEGRYIPVHSNDLKPFLGFGIAAHAINAEGRLINGTFAERALDNIAVGLFATAGVSVKVLKHFGVDLAARGDLLSSFRSTQLRAGATYYFGHVRGMQPPPVPPPGPPPP
jgi:hypothetical protein